MKRVLFIALLLPLAGQAQLKSVLGKAKEKVESIKGTGSADIAAGLKEALQKGVSQEVAKLTAVDGFHGNDQVKILFPEELKKVESTLRKTGLGNLADEGIRTLNRAAEDAVKQATPIFVDAIRKMTVTDARNILMGPNDAATSYLMSQTRTALYAQFSPVVQASLGKVGADKVWHSLITRYNGLPLTSDVNPDINDHVTQKALDGVFAMIAVKELDIRQNTAARTSDLLKKVFAMQDKK